MLIARLKAIVMLRHVLTERSPVKRIIIVLGLVAFFILTGQKAYACSCMHTTARVDGEGKRLKPDTEALGRFWREHFKGAAFVGTVTKIQKVKVTWFDEPGRMKKVTVSVERSWAGVNSATFVIYTALGKGGDCGVNYVKGEKYFFYADVIGGLLETNACSAKEPESDFAKLLREVLGEGKVWP